MDWRENFYMARYHLSISNRMLNLYDEYSEKRVLVGVIKEGALAAKILIKSFLEMENVRGGLDFFAKKIGPKYLSSQELDGILKIIEIEQAQRLSRVEFAKRDKIILLTYEGYKILTVSRLKEFIKIIDTIFHNFRQV